MATFTNQATLTYNGTQTLSNVTTGQLIESLTVSKTSSQTEYGAGERITYAVSVQNTGTAPYNGLTLTDDLGAFSVTAGGELLYPLTYVENSLLCFVNGTLQTQLKVTSQQPLTAEGFDVPAGGNAVLVYVTQANGTAPLEAGGQIVNTAYVEGGGLTQSVSDSYTVTVSSGPLLTVEKSLSPLTVSANGEVTYTFVISNYGNTAADASANAQITDTLDPVLTGLTVTYNGGAWAEGTDYTYSEQSGQFVSTEGQITVPAAAFTRNTDGTVTTVPGVATLVIQGTIG